MKKTLTIEEAKYLLGAIDNQPVSISRNYYEEDLVDELKKKLNYIIGQKPKRTSSTGKK